MKKISIEALLTWAFTVELPKVGATDDGPEAFASSSYAFDQVAAYGCMVDGYGTPWDQLKIEVPHPDAISIGDAVRSLGDRDFDIAEGWFPFPEWNDDRGLIRTEVARIAAELVSRGRINGRHAVALVASSAVLNRGPDWTAREPKVEMVTNSGKPAWFITRKCKDRIGNLVEYEDNGFDRRKGKPLKGAYRKYRLNEPVRAAVVSRLEWQIWQSALTILHQGLSGSLLEHDLLPFYPNMQPWATIRQERAELQATDIAAE